MKEAEIAELLTVPIIVKLCEVLPKIRYLLYFVIVKSKFEGAARTSFSSIT